MCFVFYGSEERWDWSPASPLQCMFALSGWQYMLKEQDVALHPPQVDLHSNASVLQVYRP